MLNVSGDPDLSAMRWTVDEPEDLAFVRHVYGMAQGADFGMEVVLEILRSNPEASEMNAGFERNAGMLKSLMQDTQFGDSNDD